jgi:hypothetical protein
MDLDSLKNRVLNSIYNIKFVLGCDAHSPNQLDDQAVQVICDLAKELELDVVYTLNDL